jgi:hypothetical protein
VGKGKSELTATTNHQLAVKHPVQPFELQIRIAFFGPSAGIVVTVSAESGFQQKQSARMEGLHSVLLRRGFRWEYAAESVTSIYLPGDNNPAASQHKPGCL